MATDRLQVHGRAYRDRLREGRRAFWAFAALQGFSREQLAALSSREVDRLLCLFVRRAFTDGLPYSRMVETVLAVQKAFQLHRSRLPRAWEAAWAWRHQRPGQNRRPLPRRVWEALVVTCLALAASSAGRERALWLGCSLALRVGFLALLRPGELLALRAGLVALPQDLLEDRWEAVITIVAPKNQKFMGVRQFVLVDDGPAVRWLAWWLSGRGAAAPLFPGSRAELVKRFERALAVLKLEHLGLSLGSLRAGGATDSFKRSQNLGALQFRGRWKSAFTLQHYLQEAVASMVWLKLGPDERLRTLAAASWWEASLLPPEDSRAEVLGCRGAAWLQHHDGKCSAAGLAAGKDRGGGSSRPS